MEAHREGELGPPQDRQGPLGQVGQGPGHAHGADRDLALGHAQIPAQRLHRPQDRLDIEQRLAHSHEHHMAGALIHHLAHAQHLINDLVHRQRALQSLLAGGAEKASHGAAHLAADADREPIIGGDAHRLEAEAISGGEQQLDGAIAGDAALKFAGAAYQARTTVQAI